VTAITYPTKPTAMKRKSMTKECGQPDRVIRPEQRHQASPPENIEDSASYSKKHYHHTHQPQRTHAGEKKPHALNPVP
jgi:hypothetical protein